jgi:hypothetical protein
VVVVDWISNKALLGSRTGVRPGQSYWGCAKGASLVSRVDGGTALVKGDE